MKIYIYEIWNEHLKDCYHECGAIECTGNVAFEDEEACKAAAEKEVVRLVELYGEQSSDKFSYNIKDLEVK